MQDIQIAPVVQVELELIRIVPVIVSNAENRGEAESELSRLIAEGWRIVAAGGGGGAGIVGFVVLQRDS